MIAATTHAATCGAEQPAAGDALHIPEAAPAADSATAQAPGPRSDQASDRNARGQFVHGNPGGPGRPPKIAHIERELLAYMASVLSPEGLMRMTDAVAKKAEEGNLTAVNWITRMFLTGNLSKAAAAEAVEITPQAEMFTLGKTLHRDWAQAVKQKIDDGLDREAAAVAERAAATAAGASAVLSDTPEVSSPAASEPPTPAAQPAQRVDARPQPRTVPVSERVRGFRVTKGPRPENGRKREKTAVPTPVVPCRA